MANDPSNPDVVTFVTYLDDGRLQLQLRGFVSPSGRKVADAGLFSINGGGMKTADPLVELVREMQEELGTSFEISEAGRFVDFVGDVPDFERRRTNHVYRVIVGYESMLALMPAQEAIASILSPEGIGRAIVWRQDLNAIIQEGRLTAISRLILETFPGLLPPARL